MAALAESLVDEWLNRQGFLTVRGVKQGVDEIDLLGVRPIDGGGLEAWHVEVQASFRPINYFSPLTAQALRDGVAGHPNAAVRRTPELIRACAKEWTERKFKSPKKTAMRSAAWPNLAWTHVFVHGIVLDLFEVQCVADCGVTIVPLYKVLAALRHRDAHRIRGVAGTDLSEIIEYYNAHVAGAE